MTRRVVARVESGTVVREPESEAERALNAERVRTIIESRRAPIMGLSDRMFLQDRVLNHGLEGFEGERYVTRARKAGINTTGKTYMGQLGAPENPLAWVSGLDDVAASCRIQGKGCEPLGIQVREPEARPVPRLAEDLVEELLEREQERDEGVRRDPARRARARAEIIERCGQKVGTVVGNSVVGNQE